MRGLRGRVLTSAVVVGAVVTGCSGASDGLPATSPTSPASPSSVLPTRPAVPAAGPAPQALRGDWQATGNAAVVVTFGRRVWEIHAGGAFVRGDLSVRRDEIWLATGECPDGLGHYRWAITHDNLSFKTAERPDACRGRTGTLTDYTWAALRRH